MEEGSSEAVQDGGALSAASVGTEAVFVRKTVKMSETRDFIPPADASEGDYSRSSGSSSAAAAAGALPDVASCTGSSEAAPRDDADADAEMHRTPDYARRGAAGRLRIAPLELFSAAPSSPPVPRPPAKPAEAAAAAPEAGAGGGAQEGATGCQIAHIADKGNGDCCGQLRQEFDSLLREKGECRRVLEDLMRENELKTKECREAQTSLRELQMELMRKSMHVGSLAFAVEGQVKEKTRWCQLLKDLGEKFKALKTEHQILLKESEEYKKCLSDATQMTTTIHQYVSQYASLESEFKDLKEKFSEEAKERKVLYNKLIELKEKVFEKTAPFATSVLDGFNVCIFAYGQTGTGKTFTMEGTEGARGVNYRILDELFRVVKDRHDLFQYEITVSALEVYNEQIHDLLLTGSQPGTTTKRLEVRQVAEGVHHVPGLVEARVANMDEAWDVLRTGSKARVVGSTNANEHSSRSHCIHCVMVKGENMMNGERTNSKLWLIDLAGSERVAKTDAQGERLKEAQNINKSLSSLGDVISALATKSQHIPFRNSKLTHLLQDSLSGDSKTLMFVQISPNENDVGETLCSLNFASRVRGIELGQARKQVDVGELSRYKLMVGRAKQDCKSKDAQIKSMEETIQSLETKNKAKDLLTMNLQDKIKELESQLLVERKIARQHVDNKIAQDVERKQQQQQQQQSLKMEENSTYMRSPMSERSLNATVERPPLSAAPKKDLGMMAKQPFSDTTMDSFNQLMSLAEEKENANPDAAAKARRVSLCNGGAQQPRRSSLIPLPRRNSLMPLPAGGGGARTPAPAAAAASPLDKIKEYSSPPLCSPPVMSNDKGSRSKRINSILRRSLQKKVVIRPPQTGQAGRRAGAAAAAAAQGIDSARRAAARRVPASGGPGGGAPRGVHQNRDKERGWNH